MLTEPTQLSQTLLLVIALAPLLGAALAGLFDEAAADPATAAARDVGHVRRPARPASDRGG